jgi:hypothetical protein
VRSIYCRSAREKRKDDAGEDDATPSAKNRKNDGDNASAAGEQVDQGGSVDDDKTVLPVRLEPLPVLKNGSSAKDQIREIIRLIQVHRSAMQHACVANDAVSTDIRNMQNLASPAMGTLSSSSSLLFLFVVVRWGRGLLFVQCYPVSYPISSPFIFFVLADVLHYPPLMQVKNSEKCCLVFLRWLEGASSARNSGLNCYGSSGR